jgi:hypothetical protein
MCIVISLGALYYVLNYCHAVTTYTINTVLIASWALTV